MRYYLLSFSLLVLLTACRESKIYDVPDAIIASGQMPVLAGDLNNGFLLVYGNRDSIMSMRLIDKKGNFSAPVLIDTLRDLVDYTMRGPQIVTTDVGFCIIAADKNGNIYSFVKEGASAWRKTARVNDADTSAKEGFSGLGSDGLNNLFALWLDVRSDKKNKIYGARSIDGGRSWSKNMLVYTSPSGSVCDCCKPSVSVVGKNVFIMFRNNLNGNRDIYLIRSSDGGNKFGQAEKMGEGSWKLDGCPMDGGGLAIGKNGIPQTVWNRNGTIYASEPGAVETKIGKGRSCTLESVKGKNIYAWVENGQIIVLRPEGTKTILGKGQLPVLKAFNNQQVLCVWEEDNKIHRAVLPL
jgi:hypothetical protein